MVTAHIRALRTNYGMCTIVFVCENMLGSTHSYLSEAAVNASYNVSIGMETKHQDKCGLCTTDTVKITALQKTQDMMRDHAVCFDKNWVSCNVYARDKTRNDTLKEFGEQARNFRDIVIRQPMKSSRMVSGKVNDEGAMVRGQMDDLMMAFILNVYTHYALKSGDMTFMGFRK